VPYLYDEKLAQYSATAYASLVKAKILGKTHCTLVIKNHHASHTLNYKVLVSNDPEGIAGTWTEEKAETAIAGAATPVPVKYEISAPYVWIDLQIASDGTDESPQASAWLLAVGL